MWKRDGASQTNQAMWGQFLPTKSNCVIQGFKIRNVSINSNINISALILSTAIGITNI